MTQKRKPIRQKVQKIVLLISVAGLLLTSAVGVFSMLKITKDSETALINQMKQNTVNVVRDKAAFADAELGKYAAYIEDFSAYIHELYQNPQLYIGREVLPPDAANKGVYSMQRYLARAEDTAAATEQERKLLGNLEQIWAPMITNNGDMITTVYVGTESGFLLSFDDRADLGVTPGSTESYYDYFQSAWYTAAKDAGTVLFTDTYPDSYGRGLMISCAAPFYDANDAFAGVVCMDILIGDLSRSVIDVDLGAGAYAFLVNGGGDIIASPTMETTQTEFDSVFDENSPVYAVSGSMMRGETGVQLSDGVYYAYTPIQSAEWKLCVHIPETVILAPVEVMKQNITVAILAFVAAFLFIILCVIWLVRRFSDKLTAPLLALGQDVQTISGGDLDYRASIRSNDEIGDLAESFNRMAASLKQYIENLTAVTADKERISAELNVATQIQASMLPCIFPAFPEHEEFDIFAGMIPAKEVGGDFYDFFMLDDDHLIMVIADVSGKGVPAALFMVIAKTLLKNSGEQGLSPKEILEKVNGQLCENNEEEMFVTVWLGKLQLSTGELVCANAGHEDPVLLRADGTLEILKQRHGFVLAGMECARYTEQTFYLEKGDKLFVCTDGVTEATSAAEELYGKERMLSALQQAAGESTKGILSAVKADIDRFVGEAPQFDDITMLVFEMKRVSGAPETVLEATPQTENLEQVTSFVEEQLRAKNAPPKILAQINIAVDEIFSNITRYSGAKTFSLACKVSEHSVVLRFCDDGVPYDPTKQPEPDVTLSAEERQIGGLGIYMVRKTMDDVRYTYTDGQNVLTVEKSWA